MSEPNKSITLEQSLQAYQAIAAPSTFSWKKQFADEEFDQASWLDLDEYGKKQFSKRLRECPITIANRVTEKSGCSKTLEDLIYTLISPTNKDIPKTERKIVWSADSGERPVGNKAFSLWNGFQVIDMDIKNADLARSLKGVIFEALHKCNWFLGVALSSSGKGLHVYTKITVPEEEDIRKRRMLYLTNFRHKYSFVYIACRNKAAELGYTTDDLRSWMDLAMFKPAQGAFIGYDPEPLISTRFFSDYIYICFDNIEELGLDAIIDWVTDKDLKEIFARQEWFEEKESDTIKAEILDSPLPDTITGKVHYKHTDRWRLANTLVKLYGLNKGYAILRSICTDDIPNKELRADCTTAARHEKDIDTWAVNRLNRTHGFKIKINVDAPSIDASGILRAMDLVGDPNIVRESSHTHSFHLGTSQYLGDILNKIISRAGRLTLIDAGPGLGKTEMVKRLVKKGKKVMMVMPFTSTIKSKVEAQEGWYYAYGPRKPRLDVERGLALTLDKFSRLGMMDIAAAGFDYIFIDESHLLFMSEYRPIMSRVVEMISSAQVPIILMTGTPTGEMVFFPDIVHIKITKEETRTKEVGICTVDTTSTLIYHVCRDIARDISEGRRVMFPTNAGTTYTKNITAGVRYFLENDYQMFDSLEARYYKKSELGDAFMNDVNFHQTFGAVNLMFCTSYLSVGVDVNDKDSFSIYFTDLFCACEIDQWCNRLRNNDLHVKVYIAKTDSQGQPRFIDRFKPANFQLDKEEIKDLHAMIQLCNSSVMRNQNAMKYNPIINSITKINSYIVYDIATGKYKVDDMGYKLVMFERKYRDYMQQLPVMMKGMEAYGYTLGVQDLGEFNMGEGFKDLKDSITSVRNERTTEVTDRINELLDLITQDRLELYRDVMAGHWEVVKGPEWKEEIKDEDGLTIKTMYCKSVEVFEKVVPIVLSLVKTFDIPKIKEIFQYCQNKNGSYNFSAIDRMRCLIGLIESQKDMRLDIPIDKYMKAVYEFSDVETRSKNDIMTFWSSQAGILARSESSIQVLIDRSELTIKKLTSQLEKIFRCMIKMSRPTKDGMVTMERVEILWRTRSEEFQDPCKGLYLIDDFLGEI